MPEGIEDLIAAFTEEVESANARLADAFQDRTKKVEDALGSLVAQGESLRQEVDLLARRIAALETHALSPPLTAGGTDEAALRMRFRHPDIWALVQKGLPGEEIARQSSRTLGEIRLITRLMGQKGG